MKTLAAAALMGLIAHSHNDYDRTRPLEDALAAGFCSVEVDTFWLGGPLLIAHEFLDVIRDPRGTLERLYLAPIQSALERNQGRVHPDCPEFTLLVDIKLGAHATLTVLNDRLRPVAPFLTRLERGSVVPGGLRVVISGKAPRERLSEKKSRFYFLDGRASELDAHAPLTLAPLVSEDWRDHFRWQGDGSMPLDERQRLHGIAARARMQGKQLRFWGTPETEAVWKSLRDAGVSVIGTDRIDRLAEWLRQNRKPQPVR